MDEVSAQVEEAAGRSEMKKMGSFGPESGLGRWLEMELDDRGETKEFCSVQSRRDLRWVALSVFVTASLGSGNWHGMEDLAKGFCRLIACKKNVCRLK